MEIDLSGYQGLFIQMQEAPHHVNGKRFTLTKGIHQYPEDLIWMDKDLERLPTCLYDMVLLQPTIYG